MQAISIETINGRFSLIRDHTAMTAVQYSMFQSFTTFAGDMHKCTCIVEKQRAQDDKRHFIYRITNEPVAYTSRISHFFRKRAIWARQCLLLYGNITTLKNSGMTKLNQAQTMNRPPPSTTPMRPQRQQMIRLCYKKCCRVRLENGR